MCRQNGVVWLNDRIRSLWSRVHGELKLRFLAIVGGKALEQQRAETGTCSSTKGVEDEEALETRAIVRKTADFVHHHVNLLFTDSVVTTRIYNGHA